MGFNMEDVMEVLSIVKQCDDSELHIDTGDLKLSIFRGNVGNGNGRVVPFAAQATQAVEASDSVVYQTEPQPAAAEAAETSTKAAAVADDLDEAGLVPVKASVTSVFYRKPSPEEAPFVEVGDSVEADTILCLLEVMKCYRQVQAETKGKVMKICVDSNSLVEEGTTLFLIQPEE